MSLEDDLAAAKKIRPEVCSIRLMLSKVDSSTAQALEHAVMDSDISPSKLSEVIEKHTGFEIGEYSIRRHRGGRCKCRKTF